jgi:hypothetical protein
MRSTTEKNAGSGEQSSEVQRSQPAVTMCVMPIVTELSSASTTRIAAVPRVLIKQVPHALLTLRVACYRGCFHADPASSPAVAAAPALSQTRARFTTPLLGRNQGHYRGHPPDQLGAIEKRDDLWAWSARSEKSCRLEPTRRTSFRGARPSSTRRAAGHHHSAGRRQGMVAYRIDARTGATHGGDISRRGWSVMRRLRAGVK